MTFKKILCLGMVMALFLGCEKQQTIQDYPEMYSLYAESCGLNSVQRDSIVSFTGKFKGYVLTYPAVREHVLYVPIVENINNAVSRFSITVNTDWDGEYYMEF